MCSASPRAANAWRTRPASKRAQQDGVSAADPHGPRALARDVRGAPRVAGASGGRRRGRARSGRRSAPERGPPTAPDDAANRELQTEKRRPRRGAGASRRARGSRAPGLPGRRTRQRRPPGVLGLSVTSKTDTSLSRDFAQGSPREPRAQRIKRVEPRARNRCARARKPAGSVCRRQASRCSGSSRFSAARTRSSSSAWSGVIPGRMREHELRASHENPPGAQTPGRVHCPRPGRVV